MRKRICLKHQHVTFLFAALLHLVAIVDATSAQSPGAAAQINQTAEKIKELLRANPSASPDEELSKLAEDRVQPYLRQKFESAEKANAEFDGLLENVHTLGPDIDAFIRDSLAKRSFDPNELEQLRTRLQEIQDRFRRFDSSFVADVEETADVTNNLSSLESHHLLHLGEPIRESLQAGLKAPGTLEESTKRALELRYLTMATISSLEQKIASINSMLESADAIPLISFAPPLFTSDKKAWMKPIPNELRADPATMLLDITPAANRRSITKSIIGTYVQCMTNRKFSALDEKTGYEVFRDGVSQAIAAARRRAHPLGTQLAVLAFEGPEGGIPAQGEPGEIIVVQTMEDEKSYHDAIAYAYEQLFDFTLWLDTTDPDKPVLLEGSGCNGFDLASLRQVNTSHPRKGMGPAHIHYVNALILKRLIEAESASILEDASFNYDRLERMLGVHSPRLHEEKMRLTQAATQEIDSLVSDFRAIQSVHERVNIMVPEAIKAVLDSYRENLRKNLSEQAEEVFRLLKYLIKAREIHIEALRDLGAIGALLFDGKEDEFVLKRLARTGKLLSMVRTQLESLGNPCKNNAEKCTDLLDRKSRKELYEEFEIGSTSADSYVQSFGILEKEIQEFLTASSSMRFRAKMVAGVGATALAVGATLATGGTASPTLIGAVTFLTDVSVATGFAVLDLNYGRKRENVKRDFVVDVAASVSSATMGGLTAKFWANRVATTRFMQRLESGMVTKLPAFFAESFVHGAMRTNAAFLTRFYLYQGRIPSSREELRALGKSMLFGGVVGGVIGGMTRASISFYGMAAFSNRIGQGRVDTLNKQSFNSAPTKVELPKGLTPEQQMQFITERVGGGTGPGAIFLAIVPPAGRFNRLLSPVHYQLIYKTVDGTWQRLHASPFVTLHSQALNKLDRGVFFKIDLTQGQREQLLRLASGAKSHSGEACHTAFYNRRIEEGCTKASCQALQQIGIQAGPAPTVSATGLFYNILHHGFKDAAGNPIKSSIYTFGSGSSEAIFKWAANGNVSADLRIGTLPLFYASLMGGLLQTPAKPINVRVLPRVPVLGELDEAPAVVWPLAISGWALGQTVEPGNALGKSNFFFVPPPK